MEIEVKQRNQRNRRRERAQRMQAQRESKVKDGDSGEDESPAREKPPRPAARRKKSREPLGEEDIIDGFAIMAFRTYEDLEAAVKCVSSPRIALNNKPRVPLAALAGDAARNLPPNNVNSHGITLLQDAGTSDDSGRASERLTGSSVAPRDPDSSRDRLSDASSRCSSGKGYICDSEGDDDKASPDNSRNASPRFIDSSMEDASDGSLFRVTGPGPGAGGAAGGAAGAVSAAAGGKSELAARGGSGGALALSRAPVGGSASPAPAPLPQPAPSPAPAALPPPAPPPPPARSAAAHIPSLPSPQRPSADSPTPAPAPSPHFPSQTAYHAALPDYRHTNHEARSKPPPPEPPPALPDYRQTGHEARKPDLPAPAAAPDFRLTNHEARKPEQPPAPAPDFRLTNHEARGKPPAPEPPAPAPDYRHTNHETRPKPAALDLPAPAPDYRHTNHEARAKPPAPPRAPAPAAPASRYPVPPIGSSHITSLSSSIHNRAISPMQSLYSHVPKLALPPYARMSHAAKDEPAYSAPAGYPPLYAPYAASMHSPYLPPAHSPRNTLDMRTSLPSSPQIPPKPKTIQSLAGAPGGPGAGAPLHAPHSFSPRHSPSRERDNFSNISSLSRGSGSTPVSSSPAPQASAGGGAGGAVMPPLAVSLAPPAPPVAASLAPPIPSQLSAPLSTPLSASLPGPLPAPLATSAASLPAAAAPLAAPTPTPAAPAAAPAPHTLAPVPTIGSISSGAKPPAHWGVTRPGTNERTGFAPAPPLFAAPLAAPLAAPMPAPLAAPLAAPMPAPLAPPNPTPFSAESLFQSSPGADLLRRELDNRFLAAAGFSVRTEMHHHQHQHTHVHQHPHAPHAPHALLHPAPPQPMFKDVSKMPSLYRAGLGLGYPYPAPLLHPPGPYAPPAPLAPYAPKPVVSAASDVPKPARPVAKTGKWNAMHVRIAWEIYNHQQKEKAGVDKDKLRAFPAAPAPPAPAPPAPAPPAPPAPFRSPYDLPPAYLPGHHPHLAGMSPFARYGASGFPGAPPPFALSPYARELLPAPLHHHPLHDPWRAPAPAPAPAPRAPPLAREHEERARRERDERERERREREDRERRKQREREMERVRQRSPLRNGEPPKEERKEAPRHAVPYAAAWEPYRFDPLHHMRFTPLVEAAIRAEEDRAKMLSAYAHHQQLKSSALLHRGLPLPPLPMPLHAPHALPLDLLKKEEPR